VFPSGRGVTLFSSWQDHIPNSIILTPEAHFSDNQVALSPYSSQPRDILIPGHISKERVDLLLKLQRQGTERSLLAAYKGQSQNKVWRHHVRIHAKFSQIAECCASRFIPHIRCPVYIVVASVHKIHVPTRVFVLGRQVPRTGCRWQSWPSSSHMTFAQMGITLTCWAQAGFA
jgi:hypothetical protein